jgi:superfamily II DNA/RNA helicase
MPQTEVNLEEGPSYKIHVPFDQQHELSLPEPPIVPAEFRADVGRILDSQAEQQFYHEVLPRVFGERAHDFCYPQVPMTSLVPDDNSKERIDFVLALPDRSCPVVVEMDGPHHEEAKQRSVDNMRDRKLAKAGVAVLRIPLATYPGVEEQADALRRFFGKDTVTCRATYSPDNVATDCLALQYCVLELLLLGFLGWGREHKVAVVTVLSTALAQLAVDEILEGCQALARLYGAPLDGLPSVTVEIIDVPREPREEDCDALLVVSSRLSSCCVDADRLHEAFNIPVLAVGAEYHSYRFKYRRRTSNPQRAHPTSDGENDLAFFLRWLFWKREFRPFQAEGILRVLAGLDSIVLLPTGTGKSIVYQLSALLAPGVCACVSPLVSLIIDQNRVLREVHFITRVYGFVGGVSQSEEDKSRALRQLGEGELLFVFVTPERFQQEKFLDSFKSAFQHVKVACVVIDEAHVVSEWGHDFRPAYLRIGRILDSAFGNQRPPFLGLTATAARNVLRDIQRQLRIQDPAAVISPKGFDRPNLMFRIVRCMVGKAPAALADAIRRIPEDLRQDPKTFWRLDGDATSAGIVFILTINGPKGLAETERQLVTALRELSGDSPPPTGMYGGKAPKEAQVSREDWDNFKGQQADGFIRNQIHTLVATSAFGMGIDKPNIRFTLNWGLPSSIEAYYQQAGRAGRDGKHSVCYLVFECDDELVASINRDGWFHEETPVRSDLSTHAYFLRNSFPGTGKELDELGPLLSHLQENKGKALQVVQAVERPASEDDDFDGRPRRIVSSFFTVGSSRCLYCLASLEKLGIIDSLSVRYLSTGEIVLGLRVADKLDRELIADALYGNEYLYDPLYAELLAARVRSLSPGFTIRDVYGIWVAAKYETVLQGRVRSLRELAYMARDQVTEAELRRRVEKYLSESIFSAQLDVLVSSGERDMTRYSALGEAASLTEWEELGLQAGRLLEASPNNPGLLLLRGISLVIEGSDSFEGARDELARAMDSDRHIHGHSSVFARGRVLKVLSKVSALQMIEYVVSDVAGLNLREQQQILSEMRPYKGLSPLDVAYHIKDTRLWLELSRLCMSLHQPILEGDEL